MAKKLHCVRIYYDVMVVAENDSEYPADVVRKCLSDILENEPHQFEYMESVYSINKENPWYSAIPYGDVDGKPCYYYTCEAANKRKEVVRKVKDMLTSEEWDALKIQLCDETN